MGGVQLHTGASGATGRTALRRPPLAQTTAGVALLALAYVATLSYVYAFHIAPVFGYLGFRYRPPAADYACYVSTLVVVLAVALPRRLTRPSSVVLWLVFVMAVVPSLVVPQISEVVPQDEALRLALVIAGCFGFLIWGAGHRTSGLFPVLDLTPSTVLTALLVASGLIYVYLLATVGLSLRLVSPAAVYDLRADFKSDLGGTPLLGYLVPLQGNVINPALILIAVWRRHRLLLVAAVLGQLVLFSGTGFRTLLLSAPALVAVIVLFRLRPEPSGASFVLGALVVTVAGLVLDRLIGTIAWTSLFVRRLLLYPGLLTAAYVSVFSDRPKALFAQSFFSPFVDYPYDEEVPTIVGRVFLGDSGTSANANLFGDGYANLGIAGIAVETFVLLVLLRLMDSASRGLPVAISGPLFVMPAITLSNSSVLTSTITHGIAAAIILAACLPRARTPVRSTARAVGPRLTPVPRPQTRLDRGDAPRYQPGGQRLMLPTPGFRTPRPDSGRELRRDA